MNKPMPEITEVNRPFFEGCNHDELRLQHCQEPNCGRYVYYPRVCCPYCGSENLEWQKVSGRGRIVTSTIIRRPQHESFFSEAPYFFIAVKLDEGPVIFSRLEGKATEELDLTQQAVEVVFVDHAPGQRLPFFRRC